MDIEKYTKKSEFAKRCFESAVSCCLLGGGMVGLVYGFVGDTSFETISNLGVINPFTIGTVVGAGVGIAYETYCYSRLKKCVKNAQKGFKKEVIEEKI